MKNKSLSLGLSGHFDPFTLSIYESAKDAIAWRERVGDTTESKSSTVNLRKHLSQTKENSHIKPNDLSASLISSHEQDHFVRHASSEIGLLLTLIHQLRYAAQIGYCRGTFGKVEDVSVEIYERELRNLNFLHEVIWTYNPQITQGMAVEALNRFFLQFDIDGPAFFTSEPNKPHCPSPLSYKNILESSAVLGEMILTESLNVEPSFIENRLSGYFNYDYDTYGASLLWVLEQVNSFKPAAMLAIRLSLDSRVPVIGSPYVGPIEWEHFHPGYRLLNFAFTAQDAINYLVTDELKEILLKHPELAYEESLQTRIFGILNATAKESGKLRLWSDQDVDEYETNTKLLTKRVSPFGKNLAWSLNEGTRSYFVMDHLFKAFNNYKQERKRLPLVFYSPHILSVDANKVNPEWYKEPFRHSFVLFSIFEKTINSYYLRRDVKTYLSNNPEIIHLVVQQHFYQKAMEEMFRGKVLEDILDSFEKEYTFVHEMLNEQFWDFLRENAHGNLLGIIK